MLHNWQEVIHVNPIKKKGTPKREIITSSDFSLHVLMKASKQNGKKLPKLVKCFGIYCFMQLLWKPWTCDWSKTTFYRMRAAAIIEEKKNKAIVSTATENEIATSVVSTAFLINVTAHQKLFVWLFLLHKEMQFT